MLNSSDINKTIRSTAVFLVEQLMEIKKISRDEALELLISTMTYEVLMDYESELYLETREAVLDTLLAELTGDTKRLLVIE